MKNPRVVGRTAPCVYPDKPQYYPSIERDDGPPISIMSFHDSPGAAIAKGNATLRYLLLHPID